MSSFVQLNVGGVLHTTTRETLMREPSSRLALMARGVLPCATGPDGALFIDRSPRFFQMILNYLRDGWVMLPKIQEERRELLQELRYYQLTGMEAWMRAEEAESPATPDHGPSPLMSSLYGSSPAKATAGPYSASAFAAYSGSPQATKADPGRSSVDWLGSGRYSPLPGAMASYGVGATSPAGMMAPARSSSYYMAPVTSGSPVLALPHAASVGAALPDLGNGKFIPQPLDPSAFKWTRKYLQSNEKMRDVVATLLELAFLPPHRALHTGKVSITIASDCNHDRMTSLLGATDSASSLRDKLQVVSVKGSSAWAFEMALSPSGELALFEKYSVAEYVQDNWFVLAAIFKDEYGITMEEDTANKPACVACRRSNVSLTLEKHF